MPSDARFRRCIRRRPAPLRCEQRADKRTATAPGSGMTTSTAGISAHPIGLVIGIGALQPPGNLLGRPVLLEPVSHQPTQRLMARQLASLGAQCMVPCPPVGHRRTVPTLAAVAPQLAAHRRCGTPKPRRIERNEAPAATPRDISSRSVRLSTRLDRLRGARRMPPCGLRCAKIDDEVLPNTRPISFSPSTRCQRSQISALSVAV